MYEGSCCGTEGALGNSAGETVCDIGGTRPVDVDAASGGSSTSVVAEMEAPGKDGRVPCCCGNKETSSGFSVETSGNGVSENVWPPSGVKLGVCLRV